MKIGLVGYQGSGKSTLFEWLTGVAPDPAHSHTTQSAMAKMFASEICVKVANEAVQIHGGYGYTKDFPVEKFYRDAKLCTIGEGTTEIQKVVIAKNILKE